MKDSFIIYTKKNLSLQLLAPLPLKNTKNTYASKHRKRIEEYKRFTLESVVSETSPPPPVIFCRHYLQYIRTAIFEYFGDVIVKLNSNSIMSEKRTASESEDTHPKRLKVAESATKDIFATYSDQPSAECQTESQSHGQPTFAANTEGAGEEFDDLKMECFDDFDRTNELDRQPVAGNVTPGN